MTPGRQQTFWIVLSAVLLLAAAGLGVWAVSERSRADDAESALQAQERAARQASERTSAAEKARDTLNDALDRAKAQIARLGDAGAAAKACLQRAIDEIEKSLSIEGITTAVQRLQDLVDECRSAAT